MPTFIYTAKNSATGETRGGEVAAKDEKTVALQLRTEGFLMTSVKALEEDSAVHVKFLDRFQSVPLKERMLFARNLSVMVGSGLTVARSIVNLSTQTRNKKFRKILLSVNEALQAGQTLSESLAKYPSVFNELFVNMVYVGEISGNLEKVLEILAVQLEKEHELLSKVRGALLYPSVVLVAMIGVAILMLTYILPKITGVFQDMEVTLPPTTQFIVKISDFLRAHSILSAALTAGAGLGMRMFSKTPPGKKFVSWVALHFPLINSIVIKVNCARFARIYSSLLRSGISVVDGLNIVGRTLSNTYYKAALKEGVAEVQKGKELSGIISAYPKLFPVMVPQMLQVGEETGKTEGMLEKLADFYEEEVNQVTKNLSSVIEPILMLVIGSMVGFFAVAMLQPMYSVLENIK